MLNVQQWRENRIIRNILTKDKWLILLSTVILFSLAVMYLLVLYKPAYRSEAKVWIKDPASVNYLAGTEASSFLKPLTSSGNPILTQVEILESEDMEVYLEDFLFQQQKNANPEAKLEKPNLNLDSMLKVKTQPGTDVIQVGLKYHNPETARLLLTAMLERLDEVNLGINRQIQSRKSEYLEVKLGEVEQQLLAKRDEIRAFQEETMAVDVDEQSHELVRLRAQLVARLEDAQAARNNAGSSARDLQRQLAMTPRQALNAVALGSGNKNLVEMRIALNTLKQQYSHDAVKLAPTNPKMVALKEQITALESQISQEVQKTIGTKSVPQNMQHIFDPVRENLVAEMSTSRAKMSGFGSEAAALQQAIRDIDEELKGIPGSRYRLANLQQEEKALALAYDELKKNQIEARIKEAETPSNVFVVDAPSTPVHESFPAPMHVLALALLLAATTGVGLSVAKTYSEDMCEGWAAIEEATRSKVLGVLPWHQKPLSMQGANNKNVVSIHEMAYKNILINLKRQTDKHDAKVLAFTSTAPGAAKNSVLYSLATRLAQHGETVAMLNTNFASPNRNKKYQLDELPRVNLPALILKVENQLRQGVEVNPREIIEALTPDKNGVRLGFSTQETDHIRDYFDNRGFRHILQVLKAHFDWVLLDAPSVTGAPEFTAISHMVDGVVLFVNRHATYSELSWIARRLRDEKTPLLGSIIREDFSEEEHHDSTTWFDGGRPYRKASSVSMMPRRVEFFGARIDAMTMEETCERVMEIIDEKRQAQHVVVNVAKLVQMQKDPELKRIVNDCDIINADGAGIVLGARLMNIPVPERVTGIDLMEQLISLAPEKKYRVYFLGAQEDVIRKVVKHYKEKYPGLEIVGFRNGYFSAPMELDVAMEIHKAQPDILFVGMSSPKKEKFLKKYKSLMNVPFVMGVGGAFDIVAGKTQRAPVWMQSAGMEWFFRLAQEPKRMWKRYLVTNSEYFWMLSRRMFAGVLKARPTYGSF